MLSREEARAYYDRSGARLDRQAFYEDRALRALLPYACFGEAQAVFEFGCGTGRFAAELLAHRLPAAARYVGCDQSATMVRLARTRLSAFADRAEVRLTDGSPQIDAADGSVDRFVSSYVFDLLSPDDIRLVLREAHRLLVDDGRLCAVGLTNGTTALSRLVAAAWRRMHRWRPRLLGGCRPLELLAFLSEADWQVQHRSVVVAFGLPSEVVVARKRVPAAR